MRAVFRCWYLTSEVLDFLYQGRLFTTRRLSRAPRSGRQPHADVHDTPDSRRESARGISNKSAAFVQLHAAVLNAKQGSSLRFHGSCCFAGKAIFLNFIFVLDFLYYSRWRTTRAADWRSRLVRACARSLGLARRSVEVEGIFKSAILQCLHFTLNTDTRRNAS